jgi:hypothetical protein
MILRIQDPQHSTAPSLHESLLEACGGAIAGGGAFAFVSPGGVGLFLGDEIFIDFATRHPFDLVVGIDEVTNTKALNALTAARESLAGLTVRVFHHDLPNAIFHPKFCWFRHGSGGVLITGSGNLTERGLRGNWEAFVVMALTPAEVDEVEKQWADWVNAHADWLKATDNEKVLARAAENDLKRPAQGTGEAGVAATSDEETDVDDIVRGPSGEEETVLVAEVSRNRAGQVDFGKDYFASFFGARPGEVTQPVVFQYVNADGVLGKLEERPAVTVVSGNYRFELAAAKRLDYPASGRPLGVFVRVAPDEFKYSLLMPEDPNHAAVGRLLEGQPQRHGSKPHMRRKALTVGALRRVWPNPPQALFDRVIRARRPPAPRRRK